MPIDPPRFKTSKNSYWKENHDIVFSHIFVLGAWRVYTVKFPQPALTAQVFIMKSMSKHEQFPFTSPLYRWLTRPTLYRKRLSTLFCAFGKMRHRCMLLNMTQHLEGVEWFIEAINPVVTFSRSTSRFGTQSYRISRYVHLIPPWIAYHRSFRQMSQLFLINLFDPELTIERSGIGCVSGHRAWHFAECVWKARVESRE